MGRKHGVKATRAQQRAITKLVRELGLRETAKLLGVAEGSVSRISLGEQVLAATLAQVSVKLNATEPGEAA